MNLSEENEAMTSAIKAHREVADLQQAKIDKLKAEVEAAVKLMSVWMLRPSLSVRPVTKSEIGDVLAALGVVWEKPKRKL